MWPFCSGQLRLAGCGWLGRCKCWPDTVLKREMAAKQILIQGRLALTCTTSAPKRPGCAFVASPDLLPRAGFEVPGIPGLTQVTHVDLTLEWALACQENLPAGRAGVGCGESEGSVPVASVGLLPRCFWSCVLPCADGPVVLLLVFDFLTLRSLLPPSGQRVVLPRNSTSALSGCLALLLALSEELWDDLCASAVGGGRPLGVTCKMRRNAPEDARSFVGGLPLCTGCFCGCEVLSCRWLLFRFAVGGL